VCEKTKLRKVLGPKKGEVTRGYRKLCNEELHNLYFSLNIIRMIKSRRIKWMWYAAHIWENNKCMHKFSLKM
jgi:hypothetical protein